MNARASSVTRVDLSADRTIASGSSITVFCIVFANSTLNAAEIDVATGDGTKQLTITVPPETSMIFDTDWIADNGLVLNSIGSDQVFVTVFHSSAGS